MKTAMHDLLSGKLLHSIILVLLAFLVYSNNYHHDYHLDSSHLIPDNPNVRSLKNVPDFFIDPGTLSVLPSNIDYRPVLQCSYALNYLISGYATWSWHLVQILLHAVCGVSLYFFILIIIRQFTAGPDTRTGWSAFVIALLFTIHPTGSGVVNYLSARSSLLTAAFLFLSFLCYMQPWENRRYKGVQIAAAVMFNLALFTKVEAVGAVPVYFLYDILQSARKRMAARNGKGTLFHDLLSTLNSTTMRHFGPIVLSAAVYFIIRFVVMSGYDQNARYGEGMTPFVYLMTQTTVWWYYVRNWLVPVNLVADTMSYPIYRTVTDPHVLLALGGWLLVVTILIERYRKAPYLLFIVASSFSLIAPTSTVAPLAEMVNEHRPYFPLAILSAAWTVPLLDYFFMREKKRRWHRIAGAGAGLLVATSFFILTYQRNTVFSSSERYLEDIIQKAPSARAYANYGLQFLKKKQYDEARHYYNKSIELAPNYYIAHINLGIINQHTGNHDAALAHFDKAVATDLYSATARIYRGEFFLARSGFKNALDDFEAVLPRHRVKFRICKGAATAASGLGNWQKAVTYVKSCFDENPEYTENSIVAISRPYWEQSGSCSAGLHFFEAVDSLLPNRWWVHHNMADLARRCGDAERMETEALQAQQLKSTADAPR
jgi:tetratricopeptide (TPR) repeat protein